MAKLKHYTLEGFLASYYETRPIRICIGTLYVLNEVALFILLTILPIKLAFNHLLNGSQFNETLEISFLIVFVLHIFFYLDYNAKLIMENPEVNRKVLLRNRVTKFPWESLFGMQLTYDVFCFALCIYELILPLQTVTSRVLQLCYLVKLYKLIIFNKRIVDSIIGTKLYVFYNMLFGILILIVLVSYVGCIFFIIDYRLYVQNYSYPDLLWIVESAWDDIVDSPFFVQLNYMFFWSIGTASGAAYGNVSASAPQDGLWNILCLYFEGFLFGFYLSRIHSVPEIIEKEQNDLLDLFGLFDAHNLSIDNSAYGKPISKQLYFRALCSLEYHQSNKKVLEDLQPFIPQKFLIDIKLWIYRDMLNTSLHGLWDDSTLKNDLSQKINEVKVEKGELLFEYDGVGSTDLFFLKQGQLTSYLLIDYLPQFAQTFNNGQFVGTFVFLTGLAIPCRQIRCDSYGTIFHLARKDYKSVLSVKQKQRFQELASKSANFQLKSHETFDLFRQKCADATNQATFMDAERKCKFVAGLMAKKAKRQKNFRQRLNRSKTRSQSMAPMNMPRYRNMGVQTEQRVQHSVEVDRVLM